MVQRFDRSALRGADLALAAVWLAALVITLAPQSVRDVAAHDAQRTIEAMLSAVLAACLAPAAWRAAMARPSRALAGLLIAAMALCAIAERPRWAFLEFAELTAMGTIAFATSLNVSRNETGLARLFVVAGLAYPISVLALYSMALFEGEDIWTALLFHGYSNLRFYNHVQTPLVAGLACSAFASIGVAWRRAAFVGIALQIMLLALSMGRATMLALAVFAIVSLAMLASAPRRRFAVAFTIAVTGGVLLYTILFVALPHALDIVFAGEMEGFDARAGSNAERLVLWRHALDITARHPLIGAGPMHFAHHPTPEAAHPHDFPLQLIAEWGLPFALAIAAAVIACVAAAVRRLAAARPESRLRGVLLGAGLLGVLVDSGLSGNLVMPASQIWIAILAGWFWGVCATTHTPGTADATSMSDIMRRSCAALVVVVPLVLAAHFVDAVSISDASLEQLLQHSRMLAPSEYDKPRFWSSGWF